jgi:hypothetical protein
MDPESFRNRKHSPFPLFQKIIFHIILNTVRTRSTKVFHGEHFSPQILALPAFHSLSPDVNIFVVQRRDCGYPQNGEYGAVRGSWLRHKKTLPEEGRANFYA